MVNTCKHRDFLTIFSETLAEFTSTAAAAQLVNGSWYHSNMLCKPLEVGENYVSKKPVHNSYWCFFPREWGERGVC